jgi:ubiquinone biosynthesis accessory factor UbiJ
MRQWVLGVVARACQCVLDSDPVSLQQLRGTVGRRLLMHITDRALYLQCEMTADGLRLSWGTSDDVADVVLRGDMAAWLRCATWRRPGMSPGMKIEGDMLLAQTWQRVAHNIDIDWAALLAPWLGDSLSQILADTGAHATDHLAGVARRRLHDTVAYAQEESCTLPAFQEAQIFYDDVDQLRDNMARCQARVDRLFVGTYKEHP